jgi:hypothetical protein
VEQYDRSARFTELKPYCHHSREGDFMEVCEWHNGEGFDVTIGTSQHQQFSLTQGQWECLLALVNYRG